MPQAPNTKILIKPALVILPTYKEATTILEVLSLTLGLPVEMDILVVDDSSPDGTADLVKNHAEFEKRIHLMQRPGKMGLATAYKDGFQWAMKRDYQVCLQMDSDLSHDPRELPALLASIENGADIAVGSRYMNGISVINWPLRRLILSKGAGIYTRILTRLPLTDPTAGFKALHRSVIENLDWKKITSDGYGFQIEVNFFAYKQGFRIAEIPIIFTERRDGHSKLSFDIMIEAAIRVLQLGFLSLIPSKRKWDREKIEKTNFDSNLQEKEEKVN